jgi:hypothetical protein
MSGDGSNDPKPASPDDIADALATALRYTGRKQARDTAQLMAPIVAQWLVEHLERSGFVVMRKPPLEGGAAIGRGYEKQPG